MARRLGILGFLRDLLCPPRCRICKTLTGVVSPWELPPRPLCPACMPRWVNETHETCGICAHRVTECTCMPTPLEDAGAVGLCKCLYYDPHRNRPVQNQLIYRVKKKSDYAITGFFSEELAVSVAGMLEKNGVDASNAVVTYLPRSPKAIAESGTDQAAQLARALARQLRVPSVKLIARRRGKSLPQKDLSPAERLKNAKSSYLPAKGKRCDGRTVILVDDIVTTGASMAAGTKLLYKMGAANVFCAAVATDLMNKDKG